MYQRAGKYKKPTFSGYSEMAVYDFFKRARVALEQKGEEDAAFYFEQVEEHLTQGGRLSDPISKTLGL